MQISLALGGGAARGAFHLGVIAACERLGIEIAAVSGTSIGANSFEAQNPHSKNGTI